MLLHCGPAIDWSDVCDPLRRSMRAATVSEGWAETVEEADRILADGRVMLEPGYQHDTVLPMASAIGTRGDYRGTPLGVEVRRVVELNTTPKVTTGILHMSSGVGQIGAGAAAAPMECSRAAVRSLAA